MDWRWMVKQVFVWTAVIVVAVAWGFMNP